VKVRVKVKDNAAVVVGGASGMGRATAERLAERGARVAVLDLPTSDHSLDAFRSVIELNLIATFNLNRLQAWHMSRNEPDDDERGVIVNTSSIAAFEGQIGQVAYSAAKAAIAGMTLTMARDLGSLGIRVTAIAPSLFATGITSRIPEKMAGELTRDAAFPRRMGRPDEYAALALAIVENQMLNGATIRLDAGQRFAPK
jgi:NAD(P)-dependent dehydrogenase (short-subunit alcohol dehydrogenase family)